MLIDTARAGSHATGALYNCAVVISRGRILGVVPKSFLPNYREYYENRWFAPGAGVTGLEITAAGQTVPFGTDIIFEAADLADFIFHAEICEDFWAATPPSTHGALAGALILCNLSASISPVVGKADRARAALRLAVGMRCQAAYLYSAAGPGESTTDLAWDGQATIHELGRSLAETERFPTKAQMAVADVDAERLRLDRMRTPTFNNAAVAAGSAGTRLFRRVQSSSTSRPSRTSAWSGPSTASPSCPAIRRAWTWTATRPSTSRCRA